MAGTVIITAANSSLAIPAVQHLLTKFPDYTAVLTVRDTTDTDINTKKLRATIAKVPNARASIHQLDLAKLSAVNEFADGIAEKIQNGSLPPLASLICNAYYWNLVGEAETTVDGYEKSIQVSHLAHAALIFRLLGSFGSEGGRIVLFASDAHFPGKNGLEKYPPTLPDDLELLVKPGPDKPVDNLGRGFQRYANSKLAVVTWMYALNRYLEKVCYRLGILQSYKSVTERPAGAKVTQDHSCRHQSRQSDRLSRTANQDPHDAGDIVQIHLSAIPSSVTFHGSHDAEFCRGWG